MGNPKHRNKPEDQTILLVDDDSDHLRISFRILSEEGYHVRTAGNGEACMKTIQDEIPALLILDVVLPDISGVSICEQLKNDPAYSCIHILLISGLKKESHDISEGFESGADGYLFKPLDKRELLARVEAAFRIVKAERNLLKAKEIAEANERKYEILFTTMTEAVALNEIVYDDQQQMIDYRILEVNKAFYEMTSTTSEMVINNLATQLYMMPSEMIRSFWELHKGRKDTAYSEMMSPLGDGRCFYISTSPFIDNKFVTVFFDITNLKQAELALKEKNEELVRAKEKAEQSDRLKSAFLANMSHEIRTPMNAIVGFSEMLTEPDLGAEERIRFSRIIQSRSDDLMHLINDLLEISRIESGNAVVIKETVLLNGILDELMTEFSQKLARLKKTDITLNLVKPIPDSDSGMNTDYQIIKQVFSNLIDNALKYTREGDIRFGYDVPEGGTIRCFVSDTGIGISPENQKVIFQTFRQADLEDPYQYGGTGLGLAICKGSLDLLRGAIEVISEPGKGSMFTFTLPFEAPQADAFEIYPSRQTKGFVRKYEWSNKQILLVEDDISNMEFLKVVLSRTRANLTCIDCAKEFEPLLPVLDKFDIILLDVRLPDANGWDLAKQIKDRYRDLPVIAQTAFAMPGDKEKSERSGCNGYISKPIQKEKLLEVIAGYLY